MLDARIELRGEDLYCSDLSGEGGTSVKRLTSETLSLLQEWAGRYDAAVTSGQPVALAAIGRDIAVLLNEGDGWLDRGLRGVGEITFEIVVAGTPDARGLALLEVPWEILAPDGIFLAADAERLYRVERRLGAAGTPRSPKHRDLALLFMAAEVEGERVLDYEREEQAILQATRRLGLNLVVEESGCLEFLEPYLVEEQPEALHLSCHGTIHEGAPVLALETPAGRLAITTVADLRKALGEEGRRPALVFLSACRTAEHGAAGAFTQALIRAGIDNAVGWDGSVYDADAIRFAEVFYEQLAARRSVAYAAAQARHALLRAHLKDPEQGQHWHLARVYLGPAGGGPLCAAGKPKRVFRREAGYQEFLDKANTRVPVASAAAFVGRRRQAQRILRAFRDGERAGVLIHGMGSLGKSSLAARIASRMPRHETVVLYERYHALAVFEALLRALPPRLKPEIEGTWREAIARDERALRGALQDLLEGPFRCEDTETRSRPILLIVDDLEQILEQPRPGQAATPVQADYSLVLAAIIGAFRDAEASESRLLLTSRYSFALTDGRGDDLARCLVDVPLPPMDEVQRDKQMRAAAVLAATPIEGDTALQRRIKAAAGGNPGLQEILTRPLLAGEVDAAEQAVAAVEGYLETGAVPSEASAAVAFFQRVSLQAFRAMLTPSEALQLRAATLFAVPVPLPALRAAGAAAGVGQPERALDRLRGLGLLDLYVYVDETLEAAVNPLARPLVEPLREADRAHLAKAVVPPLWDAWKDEGGSLPVDRRGLELANLALLGGAPAQIVNAATLAGGRFLFDTALDAEAALRLVSAAVAALDRQAAQPDLHLLRLGAECAERLGDGDAQDRFLQRGLAIEGGEPRARAMLLYAHASRLITTGHPQAAERTLREAAETFDKLGDVRERAVTMGRIADVLEARGQLDEALRIRREEQLPVYERLGDVRERAVTMGKIADILAARGQPDEALHIRQEEVLPAFERLGDPRLQAVEKGKIADVLQTRGQLDEALRIRREEQLPVYERLGDVRARAVTLGKIADILQARGQLDEALRILREEELPVYERLGDVRERALTMGRIADILEARGQLDEALRIRREEELPVYERLGDVRERALTMGRIADILQARGQLDEALRIRREEELPVYERLGDVQSRAVTMGQIADVLQARGQLDEALRIRREEVLPAFERLGDVRERAVTMGRIADILQARGQPDEALRLRREEQLPVFERLGDVRSRAVTMGQIADILQARGQLEEALRLRREEELPVFERLGDVRERAVTMGKIADILQARGQLDEALRLRREEQLPVFERLGHVRERAVTLGKIADVLQARGQLDEALRIRREEELPVYERLGDVRERAVTMGKIADVLEARGQLDEALRVHLEERLPVAQALQHMDSIAHIRFSCARIRLQRGGLEHGEAQTIVDELAESFQTAEQLGHSDAVGHIGATYGQVLAKAGHTEQALAVLESAAEAFTTLQKAEAVAQIRALRDSIRKGPDR